MCINIAELQGRQRLTQPFTANVEFLLRLGWEKKAEIIQQGMNIAGYEEYSPTPSITLNFSQLQLKWTR